MTSFVDVFERKEIKYRIDSLQRACIETALQQNMIADAYAHSHIVSLYFDTPQRDLISRSLEKPLYKEKLRVRSYGTPKEDTRVFVELKKKYKGIVYKRRVSLSYQAALAWLSGCSYDVACLRYPLADPELQKESFTATSLQIAREIDAFRNIHPQLLPSMTIAVDRYSLASIPSEDEPPTRVTFDSQVRYFDHFSSTGSLDTAPLLIGADEHIMELKVQGAYPLWLRKCINDASVLPSSFSKYGEAYRRCNQTNSYHKSNQHKRSAVA